MELTDLQWPLIIGHRGYAKRFPENTLISFQGALEIKVRMIELDVALSRDRKVVVIHDDTLERTTNGEGRVCDHTLQELKRLRAGTWFDRAFAGETIPALEEVLDLAGTKALLNIEIKSSAYEAHQPDDAVEKQVVEMVRQKKLLNSVLISSLERKLLENIAAMESAPARGLVTGSEVEPDLFEFCKRIEVFSWHPWYETLCRELVDLMHEAGIRVFPYTVNSREDLRRLGEMGVDGIFTDDPSLFLKTGSVL